MMFSVAFASMMASDPWLSGVAPLTFARKVGATAAQKIAN
jgi:hypothetical protein